MTAPTYADGLLLNAASIDLIAYCLPGITGNRSGSLHRSACHAKVPRLRPPEIRLSGNRKLAFGDSAGGAGTINFAGGSGTEKAETR
jgi:hypothetical protein